MSSSSLSLLTLFVIVIVVAIRSGEALPYHLCANSRYATNCEVIHVFNKNEKAFLSLFNVTLGHNQPARNLNALRGKSVRVIADNMLPYITSSNYSQDLGGFLGDIWRVIQKQLGFKSVVSSIYYDTGLNIMVAGGADVMLAAYVPKPGLTNVKVSQPYFYNWYHLFVKSPTAKGSSTSYLKTFDSELWIATLAIFVLLTVSVWGTAKFFKCALKLEHNVSMPSCFLGICSGFINQGFDLRIRSYSGRLQVMVALLLGVVLYSAMNAVLVAQLAVFDVPFPLRSLEEIARKRTHSLCLRSNSFVYNNFTETIKGNREPMSKWKGILNGPGCLDINNQSNLVQILCKDHLAILENRVVMANIIRNYEIPCQVIENSEKMFGKGNSFLLYKKFHNAALIDRMEKKMRSSGILQRLELKWIRREKLPHEKSKSPQVSLDHVEGVLMMYFGGILASLIVLAVEKVWYNLNRVPYIN